MNDKSSSKIILCDKKLKYFVSEILHTEFKGYNLHLLRYYIIFSPILKLFSPRVNLFVQCRQGQQNLIAFSLYKISNVFVVNANLDSKLRSFTTPKIFSRFKLLLASFILRVSLGYFIYEEILEPGLKSVKYVGHINVIDFNDYVIKHHYDLILLDFPAEGLNLEITLKNIEKEFSKYTNIAIKTHPMEELGISRFLPYDILDKPIPVEFYNSQTTTFYILKSSASSKLQNVQDISRILTFADDLL